jgi:RNA:NAD 2'-phosphotransferase (TPT1/KptA family)
MKERHVRVGKFLGLVPGHNPEKVGIALDREITFGDDEPR